MDRQLHLRGASNEQGADKIGSPGEATRKFRAGSVVSPCAFAKPMHGIIEWTVPPSRATRVDWWPEMHFTAGLEGQVHAKLHHPR